MALVPMKQVLDEAEKGGYGVGAFNMNNMEQLQAIMDAATEKKSPVILQVSEGALKYSDMEALPAMLKAMVKMEKYAGINVALHLDHGRNIETCKRAIKLGFTSVMYDGSLKEDGKTQEHDIEANIARTREVVAFAHARGVTVEAELGALGGSDDVAAGKIEYTDPAQAARFVKETGVDALAISVGTSHGAYKSVGEIRLDQDRITRIKDAVREATGREFPLVLHGASSVPKEMVESLDRFTVVMKRREQNGDTVLAFNQGTPYIEGGKPKIRFEEVKVNLSEPDPDDALRFLKALGDSHRLAKASGVPNPMKVEAIRRGVRKVNIDTDGRLANTDALLTVAQASPDRFDPRDFGKPSRAAMQKWVASQMETFGCAGRNGDYQPKSLEDMRRLYELEALSKAAPNPQPKQMNRQ
ncbi:MAG: ketose-bisphosphate aldolase [Candidatus Altiarchaeota archaeon]